MSGQPTPQPAGDAAIAQAFRSLAADKESSGLTWDRAKEDILRAAEIETARAIQAGKVEPFDDATCTRAIEARNEYLNTHVEHGLAIPAMRAALEAALAGSQEEVVGKCPRCGTPEYEDGDGITTICACRSNTTPDPAAPDGAVYPMTDSRAIYFLRRFKNDEKLLGPNEQLALDYCIAALSKPRQSEAVGYIDEIPDDSVCIPGRIARWHGDTPAAGTKLYTAPPAAIPDGMVVVNRSAVEMLLHKFERAGGPFAVAQRGVQLGALSWGSNVENSLLSLAESIAAAPGSAEGG